MEPRPLKIVNAAVHSTLTNFLPDISQVLKSIGEEVRPEKGKKLLWAGCWYRLPGRGLARNILLHRPLSHFKDISRGFWQQSAPHSEQVDFVSQLRILLDSETIGPHELTICRVRARLLLLPIMIVFFLVFLPLRELLPHYGMIFLPLNIPWSAHHGFSMGLCLRHASSNDTRCISKVELARNETIGTAFLIQLRHILRFLN
ncbi:hypothetical protein F5I97DRAFT_189550 [Phlebopus sp. FC_14]|nr:hypothetical protein F5I97DRAFT_189550 [Phlebopus sp. FC_14]